MQFLNPTIYKYTDGLENKTKQKHNLRLSPQIIFSKKSIRHVGNSS